MACVAVRRQYLFFLALAGCIASFGASALPPFRITSPIDNAVVNDHEVDVRGGWSAPVPGVVVTVNGVRALVDGKFFLLPAVRLVPGPNEIVVTASGPDGASTRTTRVWSSGTAPVKLTASPAQGFAPLNVRFAVQDMRNREVVKLEVDTDANGENDIYAVWTAEVTHTFAHPGVQRVIVRATFDDGESLEWYKWIGVADRETTDVALKHTWSAFVQALTENDKSVALQQLTERAKAKYEPVLQALMVHLPEFAASLSAIQLVSLESGIAEYLVSRNLGGTPRWFFVHFLQEPDGTWRLEDM
jgi:hypothetical protein